MIFSSAFGSIPHHLGLPKQLIRRKYNDIDLHFTAGEVATSAQHLEKRIATRYTISQILIDILKAAFNLLLISVQRRQEPQRQMLELVYLQTEAL